MSKFGRNASCAAACTAMAFASAAASAQTWVISTSADDAQNAPTGSLREALLSAQAGDVVTFGRHAQVIELKGPLPIPQAAKGLVIQGRAQLRPANGVNAVLQVFADDVKIDDVAFQDVDVNVDKTVSGTQILGCDFFGTASIDLDETKLTTIGSVAEPNTFSGPEREAITLLDDDDTSIVGNTFSNEGFAVDGSGSDRLLVDQNTTHGAAVFLTPMSAKITNNKLTVTKGFAIDVESVGATSSLPDPVLIDSNTIHASGGTDGIDTERVNVTISNNDVFGKGHGTGILAACGGAESFSAGPVVITANTVKGFFSGIEFLCDATQSPTVTMSQDDAVSNKDFGFSVNVGPLATVTLDDEFASGNGKGKTGGGAKFDVDGDGVDVKNSRFESNNGVGVQASSRGGTLSFDGDAMKKNKQAGALVSQGAGHVSFNDCALDQNKAEGARFGTGAKGEVVLCDVQGNARSGVFADAGSLVKISQGSFQGNGGPGIDLAEANGKEEVTPNTIDKTSNGNIGWPGTGTKNDEPPIYDPATGQVKGRTSPGFVVEAFTIEAGKRKGDPHNGEGMAYLGFVTADAGGDWAWPPVNRIECPDAAKLTFTATSDDPTDPVTSEFSRDVTCPDAGAGWAGLVIPKTVHLGNIAQNGDKGATVTITNNGASAVTFTLSQLTGDFYGDGAGEHTLQPGEHLDVHCGASAFGKGYESQKLALSAPGRTTCYVTIDFTGV